MHRTCKALQALVGSTVDLTLQVVTLHTESWSKYPKVTEWVSCGCGTRTHLHSLPNSLRDLAPLTAM